MINDLADKNPQCYLKCATVSRVYFFFYSVLYRWRRGRDDLENGNISEDIYLPRRRFGQNWNIVRLCWFTSHGTRTGGDPAVAAHTTRQHVLRCKNRRRRYLYAHTCPGRRKVTRRRRKKITVIVPKPHHHGTNEIIKGPSPPALRTGRGAAPPACITVTWHETE